MDKALYTAMSGARFSMLAQTIHSNNLANVSTNGFKGDLVSAMSYTPPSEAALTTRAFVVEDIPTTNFALGTMVATGNDLDIAMDGDGWIAIQGGGGESYVKSTRLQIDAVGVLRDGRGNPVLGNGGPIAIPEFEKLEIGSDGTITIRALGQGPETLVEVDRIKMVNPDEQNLEKREDGLIYSRNGAENVDANARIKQGVIEGSNVNAIDELTNVIAMARDFEMQFKVMQNIGQMAESSSRLLQVQV